MINEQQQKAKHSSWWKRRTQMEKWLSLLLLFLFIALIIILSVRLTRRSTGESKICFTPRCIETASSILKKIDVSVNPCHDFYEFTCGNFMRNTVLSQSKTIVSSFTIVSDIVDKQLQSLLEKPIEKTDTRSSVLVKSIYQACMNTTEIEAHSLDNFKDVLKSMGGWPVIEGESWNEQSFNFTSLMYKLINYGFYSDIFFDVSVQPDVTNSSRKILTLDQPYIVSFDKLMRKGLSEKVVNAYYEYMVQIAKAFGAKKKVAETEMKEVINLDIALTRITIPDENRRNLFLENNKITIGELSKNFSYIPWLTYINTILNPIKTMSNEDVVTVTVPQYFSDLRMVIEGVPSRTLANYINWKIVKSSLKYLNNNVRDLQLQFGKAMSGRSERDARSTECIQNAKSMYIASGALYVRHFFNKQSKDKMLDIVKRIKSRFIENLRTVPWMDSKTRLQALQKAENIKAHIAYPDEFLDTDKIETYYKNLNLERNRYLESMHKFQRFSLQKKYAELDRLTDQKDWKSHAYAVVTNAFYDENENSIEFPASILQDVFFDKDRPQYMNYGSIGYIIGHEITHGFDDEGRQFDKDGNLVDWWQPKTKIAFDEKAQCIIEQYGNITVPEINLNLNGINTQGENIADNGGIKQAYFAYKNWIRDNGAEKLLPGLPYTSLQMFWISAGTTWCQKERVEQLKIGLSSRVHSPSHYRVNIPLMNFNSFSDDFNCALNTPMNPEKKCVVW